jgi:predicted nuclease of restriction endonuclease-like (RecB) superfamily
MNKPQKQEYLSFLAEIKEKIYQAQYKALKAVNTNLINLYWEIGKGIIEKQNLHGWGKSVVENLSEDLQKEFPGVKGFSDRNLWRMRTFSLEYSSDKKLPPLVAEISWSHNIILIEKCKDLLEREFYMKMTKKYGWTKNVLIHQVEGKSYEHFLLNQTNFNKSLAEKYKHQAKLAVKDSYNFDFLEMSESYSERDLELGLIKNIRSFLTEMGGEYTFVGNQYKLDLDGKEYFIDLLLYHRKLKSLIAIELKATEFKPEFAGKMQFYLSVLDDKVKLEDENPSIGIIVCKSKNRTVVEYALRTATKPMGIADYSLTNKVPKELKGLLPSPEEIAQSLEGMIE